MTVLYVILFGNGIASTNKANGFQSEIDVTLPSHDQNTHTNVRSHSFCHVPNVLCCVCRIEVFIETERASMASV